MPGTNFTSHLLRAAVAAERFAGSPVAAGKGKGKGKAPSADSLLADTSPRGFVTLQQVRKAAAADCAATIAKLRLLLEARSSAAVAQHASEEADLSDADDFFGADVNFRLPDFQILGSVFDDTSGPSDNIPAVDRGPPPASTVVTAAHDYVPTVELEPKVGGRSDAEMLDGDWLLRKCAEHLAAQGSSGISAARLSVDVLSILRSDKDDDDIQNALVDLIGYGDFELLTTLVTRRREIVARVVTEHAIQSQIPSKELPRMDDDHGKPQARPAYGSQVTVLTEDEKRHQKKKLKEMRKQARQTDPEEESALSSTLLGLSATELYETREAQLRSAAAAPLVTGGGGTLRPSANPTQAYPNVYLTNPPGTSAAYAGYATKFVDVPGTVRTDGKEWEEVTVPVPTRAPIRGGEKIIEMSEMDDLCKGAFEGYKSLNRVQSIVYPIAYRTNENMLVCAPTGAGKTDVAMLTILRAISNHMSVVPPGTPLDQIKRHVELRDFKIVYVAPMKALAAEVVRKLGSRLEWLNVQVRELTGDMQLTKAEISDTQIIVTTPEKWDVVTRKATGDVELVQKVKLLIVDEVHLLHDDRGSVIETLIARTQRQVERSQAMIRIVGLSATLPNYVDVAEFLGVNPYQGMFFFDSGFRPVPLEQHFLGVKGKPGSQQSTNNLNNACYEKAVELVRDGHQVMVFVHARKETVKSAMYLRNSSLEQGTTEIFAANSHPRYEFTKKEFARSKNKEMKELFDYGFSVHHAGMLRSDRTLVEKAFADGVIKVLCCTATLAWGVNLPAYAVIIRGTQVYSIQQGGFVDLSILDVLQIFGRAGRPQYESHGVGYILTTHDKLAHYISAITHQHPIESRFDKNLVDNLNAEISLGTVTTVDEGLTWLGYTYLYVRMKKNCLAYGITYDEVLEDPLLGKRRRDLIIDAAKYLHRNQMITFDENTGYVTAKDLGRTAANFYVSHSTIAIVNEKLRQQMGEAEVLDMLCQSKEFEQLKVRDNEIMELTKLRDGCMCEIKDGVENTAGKVNVLLQNVISRSTFEDFALVSDASYVAQNSARLVRALFEIALNRSYGDAAGVLLSLSKMIEKRMWSFEHPLAQMGVPGDILMKLERLPEATKTITALRDATPAEIGRLIHNNRFGPILARCVEQFPVLLLDVKIAPITRNVLRIHLSVTPDFAWNDRVHGSVQPWWIWVEDSDNVEIYHSEPFLLHRRNARETQYLAFTIPIPEPLPAQIYIHALSDTWLGAETVLPVSFQHLILPDMEPRNTDLLDLQPLGINALNDPVLEDICGKRFNHFNPVQTQIFHVLYQTHHNALIGAPTGSGKTVCAEFAMWWAFKSRAKAKVVYIAPMKALVRERVDDWRSRLAGPMKKRIIELTGDVTPDIESIENADIIITTPEKWDGVSRGWQTRSYVKDVALVIIDEIHLLGGDRGPILEVIVSRTNFISASTDRPIRIVGLSTALANAHDVADWLGVGKIGLYNFRHSVRPVPLEIYIDGFPGKHYCPRMATMNKPTYAAIKTHSPTKPVIVFVSSRRQTRLTAQDLMAYCAMEDSPRRFLHIPDEQLDMVLTQIRDPHLRLSLGFGIGLHHAGLVESDRKTVEELFVNMKIQILIATSTLAWGVNFPAHLVVIKGTEFYDAKKKGYTDFPITDVLQMMGRAGRPQFDDSGIAQIFVHDVKKNFYKKFLHEPFPVESSLHNHLADHVNAEIAGGSIQSKQQAVDYLRWTYFFRRLSKNPTYYGLEDVSKASVDAHLRQVIEASLRELVASSCVEVGNDEADPDSLGPSALGKIASSYYLSHTTIRSFVVSLKPDAEFPDVLRALCDASEYDEMPVRHNEDIANRDFEKRLPLKVSPLEYDDPHAKCLLLVQAHLLRIRQLPIADYVTDAISVMDQAVRVVQAMVDVAADAGYLGCALMVMNMMQCIMQACWIDDHPLLGLPHIEKADLPHIKYKDRLVENLPEIAELSVGDLEKIFKAVPSLNTTEVADVVDAVSALPIMDVRVQIFQGNEVPRDAAGANLVGGELYSVRVQASKVRRWNRSKLSQRGLAHCPRFHKSQQEGWWMVVADVEADKLISVRRVGPPSARTGGGQTATATIKLPAPSRPGIHNWTIFVVSDCYRSLDRVVEVPFMVYGSKDEIPP